MSDNRVRKLYNIGSPEPFFGEKISDGQLH